MHMQDSYFQQHTWRLDVVLNWDVPIPRDTVVAAYLGLGPAGGLSASPEGRPAVSLYANALDSATAERALDFQLATVPDAAGSLRRDGAPTRAGCRCRPGPPGL